MCDNHNERYAEADNLSQKISPNLSRKVCQPEAVSRKLSKLFWNGKLAKSFKDSKAFGMIFNASFVYKFCILLSCI